MDNVSIFLNLTCGLRYAKYYIRIFTSENCLGLFYGFNPNNHIFNENVDNNIAQLVDKVL
jgi:hypothetical protein